MNMNMNMNTRRIMSILFSLLIILPIFLAIVVGIIPSLFMLRLIFISMSIDFVLALGIYLYIRYK